MSIILKKAINNYRLFLVFQINILLNYIIHNLIIIYYEFYILIKKLL